MKKFNLVALAVILIASPLWSGWLQTTQAAYTATLTFANPANGVSRALDSNNQFTIDVNLSTAGQDSTGTDIYVNFDNNQLDFIMGGSSISSSLYPANSIMYPPSTPIVNPLPNRVAMGATKSGGGANININTPARFATLQFGLKSGVTLPANVQFSFYYIAQGSTTDSNITSTSLSEPDLLAAPASATITLTAYVPPVQAPALTSLTPNNGPAAGGTPVVIAGSNFGSTQGASSVKFGSTTVTPTAWSATSITAPSPLGTAGNSVQVTVATSAGTSNGLPFTYNTVTTSPNITNINPDQGTENGGTSVTLTGTNFGSTEGTVSIGGQTVSTSNVTWSNTSIVFTTPAYSVSSDTPVNVSITTSGSQTSNTIPFTYLNEGTTTNDPYISYLDPNSGLANVDVVVTIIGSNFGTTSGSVTFGQYGANISSWTDAQIKVTAPKLGQIASSVTYEVKVTRSDGKYDTSYYTYLAPTSTGGTTTETGMPMGVWAGLISANGVLAFLVKRRFF